MEPTPPPATSSSSADIRTWNVLCHASALLGFFFPWAGHILAPLIVWLVKRGDSPEIDAHGKESVNFQLTMLIYSVISGILCLVLARRSQPAAVSQDCSVRYILVSDPGR